MDTQGRSRLIIGGLTLAAIVLVISLLLTQQSSSPPVVESPIASAEAVTTPDGAETPVAEASAEETQAQESVSPLAVPIAESPLLVPSASAAMTESATTTETATLTETAEITPPLAVTATSTVTVSLVAPQPLLYDYEVVATYPHDPEAFTQGLQYVDGLLYEGTGLYGQSSLRRVDLETGTVEQQIAVPQQYFGEGIVVLEDHIYQLTWQSHVAFLYDKDSFELLDQFSYPTEGWGLTYDGEDLLMSDGSSTIFRRDPDTFEDVGQIQVLDGDNAVNLLNELEYIDNSIWANVWQTDEIVIIDPSSGQVIARVDFSGLLTSEEAAQADVLNGIAYDEADDRIFVTGKFWPSLFEIKLIPR